jgi:hypothetical protein
VAERLLQPMNALYNGEYFQASDDSDQLNMSSISPIYPMQVIDSRDPRAISTARALVDHYQGRMIGHDGGQSGFPWAGGVLATIFARQGDGDQAWAIIDSTRPTLCTCGGMTEVMEDGQWNMQYFGTAQSAVCTALHSLLLQTHADVIDVFPALPAAWTAVSFERLLAAGLTVSAALDGSEVVCTLRNDAPVPLTRQVRCGDQQSTVTLASGDVRELRWTL